MTVSYDAAIAAMTAKLVSGAANSIKPADLAVLIKEVGDAIRLDIFGAPALDAYATQADAEAGLLTDVVMSPLRTKQAIDALGSMDAGTYDPAVIAEQVVGLTAAQTLTNKTLTEPVITLKQGATPNPTANGQIEWDNDTFVLKIGDGSGSRTFSDETKVLTKTGNLADVGSAATSFANIKQAATTSATGVVELATDAETQTGTDTARAITPANLTAKEATAAQYQGNTADRILTTDQVWSAGALVTLTDAATIAVDMSTFVNATVTLGGNRTLGSPTNEKVGQSGAIVIVQDGTGSRTLAYGSEWKFAGGVAPVLSTAAGSVDVLFYMVRATGFVLASLTKGWA